MGATNSPITLSLSPSLKYSTYPLKNSYKYTEAKTNTYRTRTEHVPNTHRTRKNIKTMNQINQIEALLNAVLKIEDIRINAITIDDDMLIINLNYYSESALAKLYNRAAGGYLTINPEKSTGLLSFALTPQEKTQTTPHTAPFAYPE